MANDVRFRAMMDDKVSKSLDRIRDKFNLIGGKGTAASLFGNVGAKAAGVALGLVGQAAGAAADFLGDANKAAMEEEASIQKLGTSLRANVKDWNGNTDAIEKVLAARRALGFSDDEQRGSLARIVVATKDVNKALAVQRTAMDLARLKGISLADASDALIKVEGGQFRALKALGIQLPKNATATQALAAVEKAAQGQAEDYAKTNAGKLLVSQVKVGEAMEKFGRVTMPAMATATMLGADALATISVGFDVLSGKAPKTTDEVHEATDSLRGMSDGLGTLFPQFKLLAAAADEVDKELERSLRGSVTSVEKLRGSAADDLSGVVTSMGTVEDASGDMADGIETAKKAVVVTLDELNTKMVSTTDDMIAKAFDPIITRDKLAANNAEVAAARRTIASKNSSDAQIADAKVTLNRLGMDNATYLLGLAKAGQTGSKAYAAGIAELKKEIANSSGPTKKNLQDVYDWIIKVEKAGAVVPINIKVSKGGGSGLSPGGKALGGPVAANKVYKVGERGPEWFVSKDAGTIIPNGDSFRLPKLEGGRAPAAGAGLAVHFHSVWPPTPAQAQEIARLVDRELFYRRQSSPR